jgi:CHAT domain-containing protein/tetratricopeptide (TPR) repeat protein
LGAQNLFLPGVVIESVEKDSVAAKAGLQVGDILLSWTRGNAEGDIVSPFALAQIEMEQSPQGEVNLHGLSGTEKQVWVLGPGAWGIRVRPNLGEPLLSRYQEGKTLAGAGKRSEAAEQWRAASVEARASDSTWLGVWFLDRAAGLLASAGQWKEADSGYQDAVQQGSGLAPLAVAQVLREWAKTFQQRNDWTNAEKYYQQSIEESRKRGGGQFTIASSLDELGTISWRRGDLTKAEEYSRQALDLKRKLAPESLDVAVSLLGLGRVAAVQGNLAKAEQYFQQSLDLAQRLAPWSLLVAGSLNNLGKVASGQGDLRKAEQYYHEALDLQEKLAPGSLDVARSLYNLGGVASAQGELQKAAQYHRQALDLRERLAPGTLDVAASLNSLGDVVYDEGELQEAEQYHRQALALQQKLAPGSLDVADSLNSLGNVAHDQGDLRKAEQYYHQALDLRQRLAPGSLDVGTSLNNLGSVAHLQRDLRKAERYLQQALDLRQRLAPGSLDVGTSLNNLGNVAYDQGDLAKAEQYHSQALDIHQRLAPGSLDVALSLNNLGGVASSQGDLAKAEQYYHQALDIKDKLAPGSLDSTYAIEGLGDLARKRGQLGKAEQYYRQALAIREKLAPGSTDHAESLAAVASVLRDRQQLDAAAQSYAQAVSALESQIGRLGGSEDARSGFRAQHSDIYRNYLDLLVALKQPDQALEVLERSRARMLLEMLSAAHIDIRTGADPSLLEQERLLKESLAAKADRRLRLLEGNKNQKQIIAFTQEIEDLQRQYQDVEERLRLNSPGYAALTQPQALTAREIHQLLDADTILLEYFLGDAHSYLFAVTRDSLQVFTLPKQAEIDHLAKQVYASLTARNTRVNGETETQRAARWQKMDMEYARVSGELSRMILGPVSKQLGDHRLLIVGDGALQYIPFGALSAPAAENHGVKGAPGSANGQKNGTVPLMVAHEVISLPSASVLAELRKQLAGRKPATKSLAVLADPVFDEKDGRVTGAEPIRKRSKGSGGGATQPTAAEATSLLPDEYSLDAAQDLLLRSGSDTGVVSEGLGFPRLPYTRREADWIMAATPAEQALEALDFDASWATATGPELGHYRLVHFATHGLVDSAHPELSGLVLSLVDEHGKTQNGFLGLQGIYNLNLAAEMVVLSACETALGKEVDGEGLVGLTRGFMYAGARRVVASLWAVDDLATAELMKRFYGAMKQGKPPAAALRQAQRELWDNGRWQFPYYWGAFQIQGEWR